MWRRRRWLWRTKGLSGVIDGPQRLKPRFINGLLRRGFRAVFFETVDPVCSCFPTVRAFQDLILVQPLKACLTSSCWGRDPSHSSIPHKFRGQGRPRHSRRYLNLSGVSYLAGEVNYLGHLGRGDDSGDHAEETD